MATLKIYNLELQENGIPVPFVLKTMEEIDMQLGGITDEPHKHNYYTIIWPTHASGRHIVDFKEYEILSHQIFFVGPGQVHQVITNPKPEGFVILFTPDFLEKNSIRSDFISNLKLFHKSDENPPLPLSDKMVENLLVFVQQMKEAYASTHDMRYEILGAYLKLFLIECNNTCTLHRFDHPQNEEVEKSLVKRFKTEVENHFMEWHQVQKYADALHVTPNYLNEVISHALNVSTKDYIQNRIVLEAKRMALFTSKTGKEIGFSLGFEDPSHFSKFFKSHTGHSLMSFKENIKLLA